MKIIEVNSIYELNVEIGKLKKVDDGKVRLFRGQTNHYENRMSPSMYRGKNYYDTTYHSWCLGARRIVIEDVMGINLNDLSLINSPSVKVAIDALIQHYGPKSGGLDVTSDIKIALWFASHEKKSTTIKKEILDLKNRTDTFILNKAYYQLTGNEYGYIYVFDVNRWIQNNEPKKGDAIDLSIWFKSLESRPRKQNAWYLYGSISIVQENIDLTEFVTAIYKIPIKSLDNVIHIPTNDIFPQPNLDSLYHRFLSSYFIKNEKNEMDRILDIEEYYNLENEESIFYLEPISETFPESFFELIMKQLVKNNMSMKFEKKSFGLDDAVVIKLNLPDFYVALAITKEGKFYLPNAEDLIIDKSIQPFNYLIQLSKYELISPKVVSAPVLRAVWVVWDGNLFGLQYFYLDGKGLSYNEVIKIDKKINLVEDVNFYTEVEVENTKRGLLNCLRIIQRTKKVVFFPKMMTINDYEQLNVSA